MSLHDDAFPYVKRDDWTGLEAFLASHPPGDDPKDRAGYAYWSVKVQIRQRNFDEALGRLDKLDGDFQCRCLVCDLRSEIYWRTGDRAAAVEALRPAPWGEEMDRFPALALETMFRYCNFLAQEGRDAPPKLVDAIPSDYVSIQYDGKRFSKADLVALIERNQKQERRPVSFS